jgi:hypothetical protein
MKKLSRLSILGVLAILTVCGMLMNGPGREMSDTTFGTVPSGYKALFDLLNESKLPVARSFARASLLPRRATLWWIEPRFVVGEEGVTPEARKKIKVGPWPGIRWIESGGTAAVFLPRFEKRFVPSLGGLPIPPVVESGSDRAEKAGASEGEKGRRSEKPHSGVAQKRDGRSLFAPVEQVVRGTLSPKPRRLKTAGLRSFRDAGVWKVAATLDHRPFVLEHALGKGRLVLIADAGALTNAWLDSADAAPFAVDLVRGFGVPLFDEREHGLRAEQSAVRTLTRSPALPVFVGLAMTGLLFAWYGAAWPARSVAEPDANAPTLEAFVSSLADLYARTGDHIHVLVRYRELTAARLRRHFGMAPETPLLVLVERLRATRSVGAEPLRILVEGSPVRSESQLRSAVRSLDALVSEATR